MHGRSRGRVGASLALIYRRVVLVPVILSGGSGTRLWPLSRSLHPKQLQPLVGERTMLQQTVARTDGMPGLEAPIVVCNEAHAELVRAQLGAEGRSGASIVLEPMGRNTAPAIALAALVAQTRWPDDDPVLLCLPADHVVRDVPAFHEAVQRGLPLARADRLVTFGIVPQAPHTGYGYIQAERPGEPASVRSFREKPDRATAEAYLRAGDYYWNSGMFVFRASAYLRELGQRQPEIVAACERALAGGRSEAGLQHLDAAAFAACPSDSIDYAVMEQTSRASVVPMAAGWSDVGSWAALHEVSEHDQAGNAVVGDVLALGCEGSYLHARHRLVAAVGLRDMVVVETADAVLVAPRERSEEVKQVVTRLAADGRSEARAHAERWLRGARARRLSGAEVGAQVWALSVEPRQRAAVGEGRRVVVVAGGGRLHPSGGEARPLAVGDVLVVEQAGTLEADVSGLEVIVVELGPS